MSELSLNSTPALDLLAATSSGVPATAPPGIREPATADTPANPFATLLSGFLQGSQPPAPARGPVDPEFGLTLLPDGQPDSGADPLALLALPGSAAPLPASPGTSTATATNAGGATGKTLPATGNLLPTVPNLPPDSAAGLRQPNPDSASVTGTSALTIAGPRISLADLALSRPLEAAPNGTAAVDPAAANPAALAFAGRASTLRGAGTDQPAGTVRSLAPQSRTQQSLAPRSPGPLSMTQYFNFTQGIDAGSLPAGAETLAQSLTTTHFPQGTVVPVAGTELLAGQLAAFAASNDGGSSSLSAPAPGGPGGTDSTNSTLLNRLGSTTLPPLQPLGNGQSFAGGLADRLLTLGGPGAHTARLLLHPEHLGELNVEIQIDDGAAQVWFSTTTSQAREAIEASLPRLKELFADQGLALTRTQVDGGGDQTGNPNADQQRRMAAAWRSDLDAPRRLNPRGESASLAALLPQPRPSARLVDAWA